MNTETTPTKTSDWNASQTGTACLLLLAVVIVSDMPEPVPFWPLAWGQAPSVGTVLLIAALAIAIVRFGDRLGLRTGRGE
jgi:peptidoglycan/LPS O-acetylase OafA/YrhL